MAALVKPPIPKISAAGCGAVLLDAASEVFDSNVQKRVWAVADAIVKADGMREAVPGINNLLVVFDPLRLSLKSVEAAVLDLWHSLEPSDVAGREIEIPVIYGGEDLWGLADHARMSAEEVVQLHSEGSYSVAAIGSMPGFAYLVGLDRRLAWARRATPRMVVKRGAVIIGGTQAGIMPCTAPSGWHIIGTTIFSLFDAHRDPPATLRPGDRIRFRVVSVET
jgi:KipI family sensor histidine kinase inhibitor